jgi:hypothetical protein
MITFHRLGRPNTLTANRMMINGGNDSITSITLLSAKSMVPP